LLPIPYGLPTNKKDEFLQTLWQVQSAALGLTITIVLFVFTVFSSRSRGSVHEFAEETGLFPIFFVGLWAIALDGITLLGFGHGGFGGWAGLWATIWSAIGLVLLAWLFIAALRSIDVAALEALRIRHARRQLSQVVDRVILERLSFGMLQHECEAVAIDQQAWAPAVPGLTTVPSPANGRVQDLNLRLLRKSGRLASDLALPAPILNVRLGARVGKGRPWLTCHPIIAAQITRLPTALTVTADDLNARARATLDELHVEALAAIAAPAPPRYADVVDAYAQLLLVLPEAWARYGFTLEGDVGVAADLFEWTFLDVIRSNAYEELLHTLEGRDRDLVQEAINLPIDVARRALDLHAPALVADMLAMFRAFYSALLTSTHPHGEMLRGWALTRLREFTEYYVEARITGG
jgi:hypothetical protein